MKGDTAAAASAIFQKHFERLQPNQVKAARFAMVLSVMAPNPGALWLPLARAWSIVSDPHGHPHCDPIGPLAEQVAAVDHINVYVFRRAIS
jgi:hypothetical protein